MCCLLFLGACGALFNIGIWLLVVAFVCLVVVSLCFIDVFFVVVGYALFLV